MKFPWLGRKKNFIDLSERYKKQQEDKVDDGDQIDISESFDDKRKKLAKRLMDMTNRMEELSNQIYHLQQRVEVLEKKSGSSSFE